MSELSLTRYREEFGRIHGAFALDAALLFFAYGSLAAEAGVSGHVLEIGVAHGLSAVAVAALRGPKGRLVAVDIFGLEARDPDRSGGMSGDERLLRENLARYHPSLELQLIIGDSRLLTPSDLGQGYSFCHIDGGHSAEETHHDLALAAEISMPGGLIAVDDHFNPSFPGVSEGSIQFLAERKGALTPLAIGANKVIYQRAPVQDDLNARIHARYPEIPTTRAVMDGRDVLVFGAGLAAYVDLEQSSVERLVPLEIVLRADIEARSPSGERFGSLDVERGRPVTFDVRVRNQGNVPLAWSDSPFGLSYHVTLPDGSAERYENARTWFIPPLGPGDERVIPLTVLPPDRAGEFVVQIDIVWEGHCWFRERGNEPARFTLRVR